jgi:hypothetical protein
MLLYNLELIIAVLMTHQFKNTLGTAAYMYITYDWVEDDWYIGFFLCKE